jgi:hypothetical protein
MACVPFLASSRDRVTGNSTGTFPRIGREYGHISCAAFARPIAWSRAIPSRPSLPEGRRRAAESDGVTFWRPASSFEDRCRGRHR